MSERDEILGAALRALPVPEHRGGFTVPSTRVPRLPAIGALAVAAVAIAAAFLVVELRAEPASAADVRRSVTSALAHPLSFSGTWVSTSSIYGASGPRLGTIVQAEDGSFAGTVPAKGYKTAFDARTLKQTTVFTPTGLSVGPAHPVYIDASGVDPAVARAVLFDFGYTSAVKALLHRHQATVHDTSYLGRPAWQVELDFKPGDEGFYGVGYRAVLDVDKATGLIVYYATYAARANTPTRVLRFTSLHVGIPTPRSLFHVAQPAGVRVVRANWRFTPTTLTGAAAIAGYRPYVAADTLGMQQAIVAAAPVTGVGVPFYARATTTPPEVRHDVVSIQYGSGLPATINISTRRYSASEGLPPADDFQDALSISTSARPVRLTGGAFAGETAMISSSPLLDTALWVAQDGLLVRIIAGLPPDQVLAVANSLRRG